MSTVHYNKLEAPSKGRNGFFQTSGVTLVSYKRLDEEVIEITAVTGRGQPSEAIRLCIPKDKAAEIGQALIDLSKEN